mgnify:CR=1 FL=1
MIDKQAIADEVAKIKQLRENYARLAPSPNTLEAIEAYHKWHEDSCVVFSHYFDESCKEYANFSSVNNDANGYGLNANYQKIRKDFCVLVDKLERGDLGLNTQTVIAPAQKSVLSSKKRIFISHASKDNELIGKFVDLIFLLGMGIDSEIIAYTSREDTGVPAGESIPQFIQDNIACADIVLLMISDNYKSSEVCLNEMGAAWALNKHIIQILLPNTSFDKLGWLCSLDKALKIDDADSVDGLCEVFTDKLDIGIKPSAWNRNKAAFLSYCSTLPLSLLPTVMEPEVVEVIEGDVEEWGFLDYREALENDIREYIEEAFTTEHTSFEDMLDTDGLYVAFYEAMWTADSVTGNGSGSYTFNRWEAEENICHNMDLALDAYREFGYDGIADDEAERIDVTIRCYLLGEVLMSVLQEIAIDAKHQLEGE